MREAVTVRAASDDDLEQIRRIYNQGVEDRTSTLETDIKSVEDIARWWAEHQPPYSVLVATDSQNVTGWASLNRFSHRCAHAAIADLSVYVARDRRGTGVGSALLQELVKEAREKGFRKIVLHALDSNDNGKRLYRKGGFAEVGVFKEHGRLNGEYVDVIAMERLL
jgi:L-amino acid N-acyltransferase YncA